jgi:5-hydroxyisourate hydrolase
LSGYLTTHVLDTARGRPARGLEVELFRLKGGERERLKTLRTNADGRTDEPLLEEERFERGTYEIVFHVGEYFGKEDGFLSDVPVRFSVEEPEEHYHVPLLVSPYSYTTYRGS